MWGLVAPLGCAVSLGSRRRRLLELYAEVAPSEEVEFLTSTLPQAPSARAITNSWISSVPSPIVRILASR